VYAHGARNGVKEGRSCALVWISEAGERRALRAALMVLPSGNVKGVLGWNWSASERLSSCAGWYSCVTRPFISIYR
jgi:hypothetical protein